MSRGGLFAGLERCQFAQLQFDGSVAVALVPRSPFNTPLKVVACSAAEILEVGM
jgi:hypothetical protein